jgi:phosphoribosylanthranilate isomerase
MKIKICGLFREPDIDYVNEFLPDFAGFVFAPSSRQASPAEACRLRQKLAASIVPVGVFVNAPADTIVALYRDGVIGIAQLHGDEDEEYITRLKEAAAIPVIKVINSARLDAAESSAAGLDSAGLIPATLTTAADYLLIDSGAGSGRTFNWNTLNGREFSRPWFLAGGITVDNIEQAMALNPFAVDVSGGAETDGVKDREKIAALITILRKNILKKRLCCAKPFIEIAALAAGK